MEPQQRDTQPRGVRLEHVLHAEVQELLDALAKAVTAGDGETVATLWDTPGFVIGADAVIAVESKEQIAKFFGGAKSDYTDRGITSTRADILDLERVGDRIVIAAVRWPYLTADGKQVGSESSDYTLRRDDSGKLRVRSVLMRGEAK
jgi:hypothetical protein